VVPAEPVFLRSQFPDLLVSKDLRDSLAPKVSKVHKVSQD
jgi:hypothetical protein